MNLSDYIFGMDGQTELLGNVIEDKELKWIFFPFSCIYFRLIH